MVRGLWLKCPLTLAALVLSVEISGADDAIKATVAQITLPAGYSVEVAAASPLVEHPLMAGFDERGRLYIAENAGLNMQRKELEEKLPNYVSRLEDTDGDGKFDKRTVFADKLTFPQGALWHRGWLYVASSGAIWRFQDKDDDGVAETREKIVGNFGYTGNAADVHGCFLGLEGRIYWCEGRHGHEIIDKAGVVISKGKAARIFSCNPDGSDVQTHCGGGMDNPVEVDWTDEGEMLGTVNILYQKRGDCLVHWMHGGVYPRHDQPLVLAEFQRTGEPLDAVYDYGHVAVSGCCRARVPLPKGEGTAPAATFFVTEFNTHKVKRTDLFRQGSTFRAVTHDFLQSASGDFHPTDVLEDTDGSLLVIDTGGWFRIGCPVSQVAKPHLLGAIYRVRRTDAKKIDDPRGMALKWDRLEAHELVKLLGDSRPAVRARAIETLAAQQDAAVPFLSRALAGDDATIRRNAVWALTRIGSDKAQASVRTILDDRDPSVVQAAIYSAGATVDASAVDELCEMLASNDSPPAHLREAATALGKIGEASAAQAIHRRLRQDGDRVLEHALLYAMIEINDRDSVAKGLADDSPRVRRAALIALDQMRSGKLTQDEVARLLDTSDAPLQSAALDVIARHPGWTDELAALAGKLLAKEELSEAEQSLVSGSLVAFAKDLKIQQLVADKLASDKTPGSSRLLLLDVVARSELKTLPPVWLEPLRAALAGPGEGTTLAAVAAVASLKLDVFDAELAHLARHANRSTALQVAALAAVAPRLPSLEAGDFALVLGLLRSDSSVDRLAGARTLASAKPTREQLAALLPLVEKAGPLEFTAFVAAYDRAQDPAVLSGLARAIRQSPGAASWSLAEMTAFAKRLPESDRATLDDLIRQRSQSDREQVQRVSQIEKELPPGNAPAGRQVFFSRGAACAACHRVGNEGGKIGPDLSTVGQRRNDRDLLEAVLFPSASLARGYESLLVQTDEGHTLTGLIVRETADAIHLRTADQTELRLARDSIADMKPSTVSIMPAGMENTMTREQLADLIAYLKSLK